MAKIRMILPFFLCCLQKDNSKTEEKMLSKEAAMPNTVTLRPMTDQMYHSYFKEFRNDPDLFFDRSQFVPYTYSKENVDRYIKRLHDLNRIGLAVMLGEEIIGEIVMKNIVPHVSAAIGMCMKNDAYKNRGYGTQAQRLAIRYVFDTMDIPTLYADALLTNTRSQHVMEKVGFVFTHADGMFRYYRIDRASQLSNRKACGIMRVGE